MILFGLSAQLAPKLNTVQIGFPYVLRLMAARSALTQIPPASTPSSAA